MRKIFIAFSAGLILAFALGTASADGIKSPLPAVIHMTYLPVPRDVPATFTQPPIYANIIDINPIPDAPRAQPAPVVAVAPAVVVLRDDSDAGLMGGGRR